MDINEYVNTIHNVYLKYAPADESDFKKWCEEMGFDYLGEQSGRRAWCSDYRTYFRDARGVAFTSGGESFLFYSEDIEDYDGDDNIPRIFYVVDSPDANEEIFETRGDAELYAKEAYEKNGKAYRIMVSEVRHFYKDYEDGEILWNYEDHSDTFNHIITITTYTPPEEKGKEE